MWSRKKPVPLNPGKRIASADIDKLVSQVFQPNIEVVDRNEFIKNMGESKEITEVLKYFNERCLASVGSFR
jgi:hypothetical protein